MLEYVGSATTEVFYGSSVFCLISLSRFFISRLRLHRLFIYGYEAFSKRSNKLYLRCSPINFDFFYRYLPTNALETVTAFFEEYV